MCLLQQNTCTNLFLKCKQVNFYWWSPQQRQPKLKSRNDKPQGHQTRQEFIHTYHDLELFRAVVLKYML